jgi:uncharacterized membrane protein
MSLVEVLVSIQKSPFAHAIAEANHMLVASLQIIHVFGFIFLLAPLILISLRVLGLVLHDQPLQDVVGQSKKLSLLGLSMALTSGVLMFLSAPLHYYSNWAFDAKMELLLAALLIYAAFFIGVASRESVHPWVAKTTVCLSLLSWVTVCMAGRAIGFV